MARLERHPGKTSILGRALGKAVGSREAPVLSGDAGVGTHVTPHEANLRKETERSRGGPQGGLALGGRSCPQSPSHLAPRPDPPAAPRVPTGCASDRRRAPTSAGAPCGDRVTYRFSPATPPPRRVRTPAPRALALRLRRRLALPACLLHDVTPTKGLERQLGDSGRPRRRIPKRGTKLRGLTAQAYDLSRESLWLP